MACLGTDSLWYLGGSIGSKSLSSEQGIPAINGDGAAQTSVGYDRRWS